MIPLTSPFSVIVDDFESNLESLLEIVELGYDKSASTKTRVATIHATTLLLAASFEEFIREMALEHAKQVVENADSISVLPDLLLETAWQRTFTEFFRNKRNGLSKREALKISAKEARARIEVLCDFIDGDITQDIFPYLIHNENNLRSGEINRLFKVSGLSDVCLKICKQASLKSFFEEEDEYKTHGDLLAALGRFVNRRNEIAHSLNSTSSSRPEELSRDIEMFRAFSEDLGVTLEAVCDCSK